MMNPQIKQMVYHSKIGTINATSNTHNSLRQRAKFSAAKHIHNKHGIYKNNKNLATEFVIKQQQLLCGVFVILASTESRHKGYFYRIGFLCIKKYDEKMFFILVPP